ncbi:hypothetical protein [Rhizobium sp. K102]|uniref:hypothetical protein n=1 Tax=Rhizobium sp. K102 TaxID=2918527 RepID=UPI001EFB9D9F|nr:hypothetical protein [Rhizobium sp. K102]ULR43724.1 hypothetical protein MHI61_21475 [Rhizobium sp. K102]
MTEISVPYGRMGFRPEGGAEYDLEITSTRLGLETVVPYRGGTLGLNLMIQAAPLPDGNKGPRFYTNEIDLPSSTFASRDAAMLDGFRISHDYEETGDDTFPALLYVTETASHDSVDQLDLSLNHLGGGRYRVRASGKTEFFAAFEIDTVVTLELITLRHDYGRVEPEVEEALDKFVDRSAVDVGWELEFKEPDRYRLDARFRHT